MCSCAPQVIPIYSDEYMTRQSNEGNQIKRCTISTRICIWIPGKVGTQFGAKCIQLWGFPGGSDGKESACDAGHPGSIPGLGRSPGEGNGNPLQYSCLENSNMKLNSQELNYSCATAPCPLGPLYNHEHKAKHQNWNSLVVRSLGLAAFTAQGPGFSPWVGN